MKIVENGLSSESHEINEDVPQGSLHGPILFLLFINDLPGIIFRSLVGIYADDIAVWWGASSKILINKAWQLISFMTKLQLHDRDELA